MDYLPRKISSSTNIIVEPKLGFVSLRICLKRDADGTYQTLRDNTWKCKVPWLEKTAIQICKILWFRLSWKQHSGLRSLKVDSVLIKTS